MAAGSRRTAVRRWIAIASITMVPRLAIAAIEPAPAAIPEAPGATVFGAVELRWRAPPQCPDLEAIAGRITAELGDAPPAALPLSVRIDAAIAPASGARLELVATTSAATGRQTRRWLAEDCATLVELTIVLVRSAIDDTRAAADADPEVDDPGPAEHDTPVADTPAVAEPAEAPERAGAVDRRRVRSERGPPPARTAARRPRWAIRPSVGLESGGLPRVGPGLALAVAARWRRARLELVAQYWTPRQSNPRGAGALIQLATVGVHACPRVRSGRIELWPGCAGVELGVAAGRGLGVTDGAQDQVLWLAGLVGTGLAIHANGRIAVVIEGDAAIPIGRSSFAIDHVGPIWRAAIGGRALLGIEVGIF